MVCVEIVATTLGLALLDGDEIAVVDLPYTDIGELLADGRTLGDVQAAAVVRRLPASDLEAIAVAPLPSAAVWGVGLNYHAKVAQTGRETPTFPTLYIKPRSALGGPLDPIRLPADLSQQVDYEAEVGIVIGRSMDNVAARDVWDHVAGVVAGNDVTARDVMAAHKNPLLAKSMPGVGVLGPTVLPLADLADVDDVLVRGWLNGELVQEGRTSDLIFAVPDLLATITRYSRLEPGDVVLTGTPPGTGQDRGSYLVAGDEVVVQVEGMRPLRTPVVAAQRAAVEPAGV